MKIIVIYKGKEYNISIGSEENTVKDLKNQIQKKLDINIRKLVYSAKLLSDDNKKLKNYEIKEGAKLTLIGSKTSSESKEKENSISIQNEEEEEEKANFISKVENLIKLGYQKEKAEKALDQSSGDFNKALDILLKEKEKESMKNDNNKNNKKENNENKNKINNEDTSLPKELKKYAIYMKILTLNEPNLMDVILQNMKENNPAILNQIEENEDEFIKCLSEPITKEDLEIYRLNYRNAKALLGQKDENKIGKVEIALSKKENEDINKLKNLGYNLEDIIEAYLLKNNNYKETESYLQNKVKEKKEEKK